jgi:hypothetical protein
MGRFGYQIEANEAVYTDSFSIVAEQLVVDAAQSLGATGASRMKIVINVAGLTAGAHTVNVLYKDASGTIVALCTFIVLVPDANGNIPASTPTAFYTADDLVSMGATNANVTAGDGYAHYVSTDIVSRKNDASITFNSDNGYSDVIVIKYRTNAPSYGINYDGFFLLNGNMFIGNRRNSDNWFEYYSDGEWHYLILVLRKNKAFSSAAANVGVTGGAALTSVEYVIFDYSGNSSGKKTADEYIDIAYIAFFNTKADVKSYIV